MTITITSKAELGWQLSFGNMELQNCAHLPTHTWWVPRSDASLLGPDPIDPPQQTKCLQRALEDCQAGLPLKTHENFSDAASLKDFYLCV